MNNATLVIAVDLMRPKVLVVEGDEAVLETIQLMLINEFNVLVARNGSEAINLFEFARPDVVVLDILLPDIDGVDVTREILRKNPDEVIIGISAYAKRRGKRFAEFRHKGSSRKAVWKDPAC